MLLFYKTETIILNTMDGQLNIELFGSTLEVTLRNYPKPQDQKDVDDNPYPIPLYKHPDEPELKEEPPVYKEESDKEEDLVLIKRKRDDAICGFNLKNFDEHRDLMHIRGDGEGDYEADYVKVDVPRV